SQDVSSPPPRKRLTKKQKEQIALALENADTKDADLVQRAIEQATVPKARAKAKPKAKPKTGAKPEPTEEPKTRKEHGVEQIENDDKNF
ncbi:MAG: hypothetical protein ACKO96_49630, partial [Flammeovirgaceae bacterium]